MKHEIDWSLSHNGVMLCSFEKTIEMMPEVEPILQELTDSGTLEFDVSEYSVDVKIHMLMPKQWPCIPNWHRDFVPRDIDLNRKFDKISGEKMYAWSSGAPGTEFKDKDGNDFMMSPREWHSFDQNDLHRGTMATEHTWRAFIRVIPTKFIHPHTTNVGQLRRHTQVYADAAKFNW